MEKKKRKPMKTKFRQVASISLMLLNMSTQAFSSPLTEPMPQEPQSLQREVPESTVEESTLITSKTKVTESYKSGALSDKSKEIMFKLKLFYESMPFAAGSMIVDYYKDAPEKDRGFFDMKLLEMVDRLEKDSMYDLAGALCINHVNTNGKLMSTTTVLMYLKLAKKEFKKASAYFDKIGNQRTARFYDNSAKEVDKIIKKLGGE
ncbi:hypothetical protein J7K41_03475 [Candidatus Micrarchaeota archaeon]|nr:hypothetical protein [Candidatus Micrarchaeota archaeon]